tara:strand:+ start:118 stop:828 length:711 start_codon:yes stop_codon:yes gene_type:complete
MSISYADMREIVAIQHKGDSHKEGEDLDQFIDCMTKIRMEQHTKIEDKVEALLNQLVFPDEMIVKMSKLLSPKKKKIKFNIKKVEEEYCDDCEGQCRADETEECEDCKIKLRIGCANNPSNHSIFDGCCDDCREEEEFYEVSCAENPDVEYFNTLEEAKAFCDKHDDLDYGLIMLCDKHKKHIGDWGDYEEEEEKCEKCDIRLGKYEGTWEMKVEWCGKTMCGECALGKAERKERK